MAGHCKNAVSKDYAKKMEDKGFQLEYSDLICDPCYRFKKIAKERFFEDVYLAFMFLVYFCTMGPNVKSKETDALHFYKEYTRMAQDTIKKAGKEYKQLQALSEKYKPDFKK